MAFHAVRFPLDVALGARGGPEWATDLVTLTSGHEARNARWAGSRRRYNAGYGVKSQADMRAILDFFEERRGRFHSFLWRDALDFSSNGTPNPTPLDQELGTGDGMTTSFALTKRYGAGFDPFVRTITHPVAASVRVALDGSETADFILDPGTVQLAVAPGPGVVVTAGFLFDVPVRFDIDRLEVELTSFDAAEVPAIPVVEVRA